jgi:outer membrane protein assembly factor BamD (BamD/ComL family)
MGEILRWQGKYNQAVEEYGRVIGLEPYGKWADKAQKAIWSIKGL